MTYLLTVSQVQVCSIWGPTCVSDSNSLNTSLPECMISSKNHDVLMRDMCNLTLQILFDAWWASINLGFKHPIDWNRSRLATFWRFYLNCRIAETGIPGIISIICHHVLHHPSECGTSSMGKHWLARVHIAKIHKLTESTVSELTASTVEYTAWAMQKRHRFRGNTIVSSWR